MKKIKNFLITTILTLFLVLQNCNYLGYGEAKDTYDDAVQLYVLLLFLVQAQTAASYASCTDQATIYKYTTSSASSSTTYYVCVDQISAATYSNACNYASTLSSSGTGYTAKSISSSCTDIGFDTSMNYEYTSTLYAYYSCATYTSGTDTCNSTITSAFSNNGLSIVGRK